MIPTRTVVWAAGVRPNPLAAVARARAVGPRRDRRGPRSRRCRRIPEIFVIGDLAAARGRGRLRLPAARAGGDAGGTARRPHDPAPDRGQARRDGSATTTRARWPRSAGAPRSPSCPCGIRFGGTLGWLSWLGLHLVFLIGFRNRVVVLVNWAWNYVRWDRGNRMIISDDD